MKAKLAEGKRNLATLSARKRAADFRKKMENQAAGVVSNVDDCAFAKFDRMKAKVEQAEAERYADLFKVFVANRDRIIRVTFWGVTDGNSWENHWPVKDRMAYPLLFDRSCKPRPAFDAVIKTAQ